MPGKNARHPTARRWLAAVPLAVAMASAAVAAPAEFPMSTTPVTLDGTALGTQTGPGLGGLLNTVVLAADGVYHMWAILNSAANPTVSKIVHATSTDGIRFMTHGTLNPPSEYWTLYPCGETTATREPEIDRLRVSLVDGEWIMTVWNRNDNVGGTLYSYTTTVWEIGADPSNLDVAFFGPLPAGNCAGTASDMPGNNHVGTFGMTYSETTGLRAWLRNDSNPTSAPPHLGGSLGGYLVDLSNDPPTSSTWPNVAGSPTYEADMFIGTGYDQYNSSGAARTMVDPIGRTLDLGGGTTLGTYYAFIGESPSPEREYDIRYIESSDGGKTWSKPARIYGPDVGETVLVDGLPARAGFRAPEVVADGVRTYFWTRDTCNNRVMVTAAGPNDVPKLTIAKDFEPNAVDVDGVSELSVTLTAPEICQPAPEGDTVTNISYTDNLPGEGNVILTGTIVSNGCGGTLTAPAEGASFTLEGVGLPMGGSCTVVVEVKGKVAGVYPNVIPATDVTNDQQWPTAEDAKDTLTVGSVVPPAAVQPIPTTGPLSLAALAALLGLFAVRGRKKR